MRTDDSIFVKKFCLGCKKAYCTGNCIELKSYVKELVDKKVISRGGRPKKINKSQNIDKL